jgi:ABC-2 type transport system ATP-binding protein
MNTINLENVDFRYVKKTPLLANLNVQVAPGHIHGLLGKNGEGKTTLLKLIAGLIFPQKGKIDVMGFTPQKRNPEMLRDIFFFSEELPDFPLKITDFQKAYAPFYPKFSAEQFDKYREEFEIPEKNVKLNKLSFGQKKKVFIAFGLATNTKILLMDEPTNGLDIPAKGQFRRMVASVVDENRCVIISTHQVRDLDSLIDNIIIMDGHEIVFNESIDKIAEKLLFNISDTNEKDPAAIYSEEGLHGFHQVRENPNRKESKPDIELLFNAVQANKQRIKELFMQTTK